MALKLFIKQECNMSEYSVIVDAQRTELMPDFNEQAAEEHLWS